MFGNQCDGLLTCSWCTNWHPAALLGNAFWDFWFPPLFPYSSLTVLFTDMLRCRQTVAISTSALTLKGYQEHQLLKNEDASKPRKTKSWVIISIFYLFWLSHPEKTKEPPLEEWSDNLKLWLGGEKWGLPKAVNRWSSDDSAHGIAPPSLAAIPARGAH